MLIDCLIPTITNKIGTKISRRYSTATPNQKAMTINIYASTKDKPMYVDEDGCVLIGTAEIEIPFPSEEERYVSVEYIFGNTEISMTATDHLYGNTCEATLKLIGTMNASNHVTVFFNYFYVRAIYQYF